MTVRKSLHRSYKGQRSVDQESKRYKLCLILYCLITNMKAFLGDYYIDTALIITSRELTYEEKKSIPKKISLTKKKRLEYAELRSDV